MAAKKEAEELAKRVFYLTLIGVSIQITIIVLLIY